MNIFDLDKPIAIGNDHAGFEIKNYIKNYLNSNGIVYVDFGSFSETSVDYPDYAHKVAESVKKFDCCFGILICGSANGVCITANKHENIRAAICWNEEISELARQHNDSNILCLPARFLEKQNSINILKSFMTTKFEGGRHQKRVEKINIK